MICKISDLSDPVLFEYLSYCMSPVPERIEEECRNYKTKTNRELYGIYLSKRLRGIIGLIRGELETELKHIAIHPEFRMQGLGSKLIEYLIKSTRSNKIIAETDKDGVNFYIKMDFEITSLGEKYPGVERFRCEYNNNHL